MIPLMLVRRIQAVTSAFLLFASGLALSLPVVSLPVFAQLQVNDPVTQATWSALDEIQTGDACNLTWGGQSVAYQNSAAHIEQTIQKRTQELHQGGTVLHEASGDKLDVTSALFLQYGSNVITESRTRVADLATKMVDRWKTLWRAQLEQTLKAKMNQVQSLVNQKQLTLEFQSVFPRPVLNGEVLFVGIERYLTDASFAEQLSKGLKEKIQKRIASQQNYKLGEAMDLELSLQQESIAQVGKKTLQDLKVLGGRVTEEFGDRAARIAEARAPTGEPGIIATWQAYMGVEPLSLAQDWFDGAPSMLTSLREELIQGFPLNETQMQDVNLTEILSQVSALPTRTPRQWIQDYYSENGLAIDIKSSGLYSRFHAKLGTTILTTRPDPQNVNPGRPSLVLWHGDGTTRSHDASWRSLLKFYESSGFNAAAVGLPVAGLGPQLRGIPNTMGFLEKINQHLVQNHFSETPVIVGGRSMGASKGYLHNLLFHGTQNSADAYFMISYSNPFTMKLQTESVLSQVKAGLFSGIIHESLQNAMDISNETLALLKKMKAKNPEVFKKFGNNMIFFQGDSDADGGPTVMQDLIDFCREYCPAAHIVEFKMPAAQKEAYEKILRGEPVYLEDGSRVYEDMLEGQHFIHANGDNNPVGAPRYQTIQSFATLYGFMDYLAEGPAPGKLWASERDQISAKRFAASREKTCAEGMSFFDDYVKRLQSRFPEVDPAKINSWQNPVRNTRDLNERLAWAKQYWVQEKARVAKILK